MAVFSIDICDGRCYNYVTISNIGGMDTDYIILGLLILSNRTIYQLRSRIDKGLNIMYSSSTGSIQAAIKKLLNNGYIDYRDIQDNRKKKKEYYITDAGRQEFNTWINSPIDSAGIKCPELSKIYFMGFSKQKKRFENTQEYITELKNKYDSLKMICDESELFMHSNNYDNLDKEAKDIIFFQLATARFGRDLMSFAIKWYEQFLIEMRKSDE